MTSSHRRRGHIVNFLGTDTLRRWKLALKDYDADLNDPRVLGPGNGALGHDR
jgi:hypothetical protein